MSYRVRDINLIGKNQLNSSVSKQQYSIPKAERFRHNKTQCSYKYYQLPVTNEKKAFKFGVQQRKTFMPTDIDIPSPDKYFKNGQNKFQLQSHSITFAKGRQECKNMNFLKTIDNPGPGAYNPNPEFVDPHTSTKYSFRVKTQISQKNIIGMAPAPNKYSIKTTWLQKNKILSTDKNYGVPLIRPSKITRELQSGQVLDLPLYYPIKTFKGDETFNKTGGFSIGKGQRFSTRVKTQIPGPGTYNRFSQFL